MRCSSVWLARLGRGVYSPIKSFLKSGVSSGFTNRVSRLPKLLTHCPFRRYLVALAAAGRQLFKFPGSDDCDRLLAVAKLFTLVPAVAD